MDPYLEYELSQVITYTPSVTASWLPNIGEMLDFTLKMGRMGMTPYPDVIESWRNSIQFMDILNIENMKFLSLSD
jgi:hypothetical protein